MPELPSPTPRSHSDFTFADWYVQPSQNRIRRGTEVFRLRPQLMDLLVCLAARAGQTVSKDEILEVVWAGQYVAESGIARCVAELRQVFGDRAGQDSIYIETIPRRGYRVIAPVAFPAAPDGAGGLADPSPQLVSGLTVANGDEKKAPDVATALPAVRAGGSRRWRPSRTLLAATSAVVLVAVVAAAVAGYRRGRVPVIAERDMVVLDFENLTGEAVFDEALRLALKIQLEQSPTLRIVSDARVREELAFMRRPADLAMTPVVAREVCQRVGAKAVLAGTIVSLGRHYAIGLEAVACDSGESLVRRQLEVDRRESVLAGLGDMVAALRPRLGESLASIGRNDVQIVQATTSSLDALKAFSVGDRARALGLDDEAVASYRRAIELDGAFALAHVRLGLHLINLSRYDEGVSELKAAFACRERASAGERLYITASYQSRVLRDPIRALESLTAWRQAFPNNAVARFTLASMENQLGRHADAIVEARAALELEPNSVMPATVLAQALIQSGKLDEASQLIERQLARHPDSTLLRAARLDVGFLRGDQAAIGRELDWAAKSRTGATMIVDAETGMAIAKGRLAEARRLVARAAESADTTERARHASLSWLELLQQEAMLGETRNTEADVARVLRTVRTPEVVAEAALALAWARRADAAERELREYEGMPDVGPGSDPGPRLCAKALIDLARGRAEAAIDAVAPLRPYEDGWRFGLAPRYIRGLALLDRHRLDEAAAEFQHVVDRCGVALYSAIHPMALIGLAQARSLQGNAGGSREAYERALGFWKEADAGLPALVEASVALRALRPVS